MTLFKDYLREKAKFYSPRTEGGQSSSTDVTTVEIERLPRIWLPKAGRKDPDMVSKLLELVDDYLADRELPEPRSSWDRRFEPEVDDNHTLLSWSDNNLEIHVCRLLYRHEEYASWVNKALGMVKFGAIDALGKVMASLGGPIRVTDQTIPPERGLGSEFKSKVDYVLHGERGTVLVEVKAPNLLDMLTQVFELNSFSISMRPGDSVESRIVNMLCMYMGSHRAKWLALTSHHKWMFLQFHNEPKNPYVSYSSVIPQQNDTRPFRALLGMMISAEFEIEVKSKVTRTRRLHPIKEEKQAKEDPPLDPEKQDKSGSYKGQTRGTRDEPPVLRPGTHSEDPPVLMFSWSTRVADHEHWFLFDAMFGADWCYSLSKSDGPIMLRLLRDIGEGISGIVYEAKIDIDGHGEDPSSPSFAVKIVQKSDSDFVGCLIQSLHKELDFYRVINQAMQEGRIRDGIVPRCYGLFESKDMVMLVMDYGGETLDNEEWARLTYKDKIEIFESALSLHDIGISHADLEPRNILRSADGSFKIIDFSLSALHECKAIRKVSWFLENGHNIGLDGGCGELNGYWLRYMKQYSMNGRMIIDGT
ncbi:kinase-like protein [Sanghuangporus baumii]|uniref:Kinase-like protein n=1 Tax=Sanghuangporus baumii TaxID=108892 RepID=A0A9Q5HZZ2_SANBA|nr:kinase-like protein [Sanghuangporus baumii]